LDAARLKRIPVFADLDDDALSKIAALAAEVSVPEGKELVREGDYSYDVLAIEEGTARVERRGEHVRLEAMADHRAGAAALAEFARQRGHDAHRVELRARQRHRERVEESLLGERERGRRHLAGLERSHPGGDLVDAVALLRQGMILRPFLLEQTPKG